MTGSDLTGRTLAQYDVGDMLGKGGMGEVYRAHDTRLGRDVALKLLPEALGADPDRLARFEREAKVLAALNHPNIAGIHGLEHVDGRRFLVMELAEGEDLSRRIARGPVPLDEALATAVQIAEGLEEAHEKGIVHRDLKPANVMVAPDGKVKILDFGLARAYVGEPSAEGDPAESPTMTAGLTQVGMILGSAAYMSPEQAKGHEVDRRTDIWSFGVILFEMLTGRSLFGAETISESIASVLKEDVPWDSLPTDVPPTVRGLMERCLERDPRLRLRDIGEARIHLLDLRGSVMLSGVAAAAVSSPKPAGRNRLLGLLPWALLAVALALLALDRLGADGRIRGGDPQGGQVVRSSLEPPPDTDFHLTGANPAAMAIAPDGRRVVFGARDERGTHRLWLQELAAAAAEPLSGTEGGQYPFWSPDGRSLAYFAGGSLRILDLESRTDREVAQASDGKGGCWLEGGIILFTPSSADPLYRLDLGTDTVTPITDLTAEPRANSHRLPRALPGGRHYLYAARVLGQVEEQATAIMVGNLDGSPARQLMAASGQADFAAGHLFYVLDGSLFARRFDAEKLEFTAAPVQLAADAGVIPGAALALFSVASSGDLVYHPGHQSTLLVRLAWYDAAGERLGDMGDSAGYGSFDISPDGSRVAFTTYDNRVGSGDIWLHDLARDARTRLTFDEADESNPHWSPDGSTLYYRRGGGDSVRILALEPDGRAEPRIVVTGKGIEHISDVSPDGKSLGITMRDTANNLSRAYIVAVDGSESPRAVDELAGTTMVPRFSPDGRWVAYASREGGAWRLYLKTVPLTSRKWQISEREAYWFNWDPDGSRIYFQWSGTELFTATMDLGGATPRIGRTEVGLVDFPSPVTSLHEFQMMPDRSRFLVSDAGGSDDSRPARLIQGWLQLVRNAGEGL